ncbi:MAG: hypothetical protein LQ342_004289 [Letrouitia transgressa]|nr:MAG: hypothetical protein LQ342_004289 [Letrouitia transgressa]
MPWRPLPRIAFAIAVNPFAASSPADLPLELGDELYIIEQGGSRGEWYRGYLVAPPSLLAGLTSVKGQTLEARVFSGIFPKNCVEVREVLDDSRPGGHTPTTALEDSRVVNQVNGELLDKQSSPQHRKTIRRHGRRKESVHGQTSNNSGDNTQDSGIGSIPSRSSSQRYVDKTNGQDLSRKLSHRSVISLRSQDSLVPTSTAPATSWVPQSQRPPAPVPMLKIGDETPTSISEPLVDEIASCLREWHSKDLHELLLSRRYAILDTLSGLVHQLELSRRQLLHDVLTSQELELTREKIVWDLVSGNKLLSGEVVVRDPKQRGRLLTGEDSSVEMAKLQSSMSLLKKPPTSQPETTILHHLMVELKELSDHSLDSPSLALQICFRNPQGLPVMLTEPVMFDISSDETLQEGIGSEKFRTLFSNLSSTDIGQTPGFEKELYIVIKVYANQLVEQESNRLPRKDSVDDSASSSKRSNENVAPISASFRRGRQSLMWAQKQLGSTRRRGPAEARKASASSKDSSSASLLKRSRPSTPQAVRPPTQQGPQYINKLAGVGISSVKYIMGPNSSGEQKISLWAPSTTVGSGQSSTSAFDTLTDDLMENPNGNYPRTKIIDHIRLYMQSFLSEDADDLVAKTPTLLQGISQTPKIGFSGAPTKIRSDIYLTLSDAHLPSKGSLSHPERGSVNLPSISDFSNVQLTLEVRKKNGDRIEGCIFPSSNSPGLTAWRTVAVERGECWNQIVKLVVPADEVPEAHLIMSVANAPGFPFALCWMPLWDQGAFIRDGQHAPLLYLYDKITSSSDKGRGAYLAFPWSSRAKDNTSKDETLTGPVATLKLQTYLCSTVFSQDKILLELLKWRDQSEDQLLSLVRQITFVPEIEIVKMFSDVSDALFAILIGNAGKDEFEDLVLSSLITILGIVHDRRFNLGPLVDKYTESKFDYPFATPCLIRGFLRLLASPGDPQKSRRLHSAFKVGRQLFGFILAARRKQKLKEAAIGVSNDMSFHRDFKNIFTSLENVMRDPGPMLVGSKTLIVQHVHTWLPDANDLFTEDEKYQIFANFLESCSNVRGKLVLYKLVLINHLSKGSVFSDATIQKEFINNTEKWIGPFWGANTKPTDQWREQVRLCCSIVSTQAVEFGIEMSSYFVKIVGSYQSLQGADFGNKDSLSLEHLFPTVYPFPSSRITHPSYFNEALVELAVLLSKCQGKALSQVLGGLGPSLADTIADVLDVISSVLHGQAFHESWLSLHIYYHRSALQTLETINDIMMARLLPSPDDAEDFNTDIWSRYLKILLTIVGSNALALETFAEQKRRAVWKIAGDVREQGASLLKRSWDAIGWDSSPDDQSRFGLPRLGGFQVQYVPSLVAPVVELCLSVHEGLRRTAVRVLQTMIISEWTLSEDLSAIETEMVDCLDNTFKMKGVGDSITQKLFVNELLDLFEILARIPGDGLWQAAKVLVSTLDELLDLLASVHSIEVTETTRIMHTLQLMDFLKDMRKEAIFIRYVHQLAELQARLHNHAEAGLALRLHADLYKWDTTKTVAFDDPAFPEQTAFERKEQLYFEMIKHFEDGAAWDCALACYKELAKQYEYHQFDFTKLARTEHSMARIHDAIAKGDGQQPRYFRVIYRGLGFPESLQNKEFIFEGGPGERQIAFADRLRLQHPAAQITSQGEIDDLEGQFLLISSVSPYRDLDHPLYQQSRVPQPTREYVLSSQPNRFAITSKRHSPISGVQDQWIEKTVFTTADKFPAILSRSEIISIEVIELSPVQTAVERTTRKTSEIAALQRRIVEGDDSALTSLAESIKSSVDPASVASVAQYRKLLPSPHVSLSSEEESISTRSEPFLAPLENALKHSLIDHASSLRQGLPLLSRPPHINLQTSLSQSLASTFAPELALLTQQIRPSSPTSSQPPPFLPGSPSLPPSRGFSSDLPNAQHLTNGITALPPAANSIENAAPAPLVPRTRSRLSLGFLKPQNSKPNGAGPPGGSGIVAAAPLSPHDEDGRSSFSKQSSQGQNIKGGGGGGGSGFPLHPPASVAGALDGVDHDEQDNGDGGAESSIGGAGAAGGGGGGGGASSILSRVKSKSSVGGDSERPVTAHSGRSGRVRKRLSQMGMGIAGTVKSKVTGGGAAAAGEVGVLEEE